MFFLRPGRLGAALRPFPVSTLVFLLFTIGAAAIARAADVAGQVVDATGHPLPRAYVQVICGRSAAPECSRTRTGRFC